MDVHLGDAVVFGMLAGVIVLLVAGAVIYATRRNARRDRTEQLRQRFGAEYDVTVAQLGRRRGEDELRDRMQRFEGLDLDRLRPDARDELTERWKEAQYRFLEDPHYSVREADHLVATLMRERGFPDGDFGTRVRAISVEQPELAETYRTAYSTFRASEDGQAVVSEMFAAMLGYRRLFETLIDRPKRESGVEGSSPPEHAAVLSRTSGHGNGNGS